MGAWVEARPRLAKLPLDFHTQFFSFSPLSDILQQAKARFESSVILVPEHWIFHPHGFHMVNCQASVSPFSCVILQEDMDSMQKELEMWRRENKEHEVALRREER